MIRSAGRAPSFDAQQLPNGGQNVPFLRGTIREQSHSTAPCRSVYDGLESVVDANHRAMDSRQSETKLYPAVPGIAYLPHFAVTQARDQTVRLGPGDQRVGHAVHRFRQSPAEPTECSGEEE